MNSQRNHKFRRCPISGCDYFGGDLKRHLGSKKHRDDVDANKVEALVQVADKGNQRKGSNGLLFRWCPIDGCSLVTCHMRKHLKRRHGITKIEKLDALRKRARPYEPNEVPPMAGTSIEVVSEDEPYTDDDEDYEAPNWRSYFQTRRLISDRHRLLVDFYNYLGTVDEGQKTEKVRLQHACQMRKILEDIDPAGKDIEILSRQEGRAVWNLWIAQQLKDESVAAGTIIAYLGSFSKFLSFVVKRQRRRQSLDYDPCISDEACDVFSHVIDILPGWRSTILKQRAAERNEHYLKECEQRLTREDFQAFLKSPVITEAEALFVANSQCKGVQQFCRARDYLIARLAVSCGTRPKPLETATIEHFEHAKRDSEFSNCYVMLVSKHKREIDGPAIVTMDERLHELVRIYIRNIRSAVVTSPEERHLFVKIDGHPFQLGTIGQRVSELWSRSGVRPDLRVTCTDFRKCIVTMAEEANKEQRSKTGRSVIDDGDLRKLLCHSQQTASVWYMRENLTAIGARAHTALENIRKRTWDKTGDEDNERDRGPATRTRARTSTWSCTQTRGKNELSLPQPPPLSPPSPPPLPLLPSLPVEINLPPIEPAPGTSAAPAPPVVHVPLQAPPRIRIDWSREDTALVVKFVKSFKGKCPGKRDIYDAFNTLAELNAILKRIDFNRCVQKVKSTFKQLRSSGQL